jgi:hypothetical protein
VINILKDWRIWILASLTLGLAPFAPEPHIIGKLKWVMGGANGMTGMDWFDLFFHGTPWLVLIVSLGLNLKGETNSNGAKVKMVLIVLAVLAAAFCTTMSLQ